MMSAISTASTMVARRSASENSGTEAMLSPEGILPMTLSRAVPWSRRCAYVIDVAMTTTTTTHGNILSRGHFFPACDIATRNANEDSATSAAHPLTCDRCSIADRIAETADAEAEILIPSVSLSCETASRTAEPFVKPTSTGCDRKLATIPRRKTQRSKSTPPTANESQPAMATRTETSASALCTAPAKCAAVSRSTAEPTSRATIATGPTD
eukprot:Amastigsp_a509585_14.p6 type:complete len:212 gc:universal Amastigsp_a509585_14:1041-1676(+)